MEEKTLAGDKKFTSSIENKSQVRNHGNTVQEKTNSIKRPGRNRIPRLKKQKDVEQNLSRLETLKRKLSISEKKKQSKTDTEFNCTSRIPFSQGTTKIYGKSNASTQEPHEKYMSMYEMKHGSVSDNKDEQEKIKENSLIQIFQTNTDKYNGTCKNEGKIIQINKILSSVEDEDRDGPEIITICKKRSHPCKKTKLKMTIHQENSKTNQLLELLSFDLLIPLPVKESIIEDLSRDKPFVQRFSSSGNVDVKTTTVRHSSTSELLKSSLSSTNITSTTQDQHSLKSQSLKSFSSSSYSRILCPSSCSTVYNRSSYEKAKLKRKHPEDSLSNLDIRVERNDKDELTSTIAFETEPTQSVIVFQNCHRQGHALKENDKEKTTTSSEEEILTPCQSAGVMNIMDNVLPNRYDSLLTGSYSESNSERQVLEKNIKDNCQILQVATSEIMETDGHKENMKNHEPERWKKDYLELAYVETPTMIIDKEKRKYNKECDDNTLEEDYTKGTPSLKNHQECDFAVESNNSKSLTKLKDHHDKEEDCMKHDIRTDNYETPTSSENNKNVEEENNEENTEQGDDFTLESNKCKTVTQLEDYITMHDSKETLQKTSTEQNDKEFVKEKINLNLFISVREKVNCANNTTDDNSRDKVLTNEGKNKLEVSFNGSNKETKRINITYTSQSFCKLCSEKTVEKFTTDSKSKLVVESSQGNTNSDAGLTETVNTLNHIEPTRSDESEREVNLINAEDDQASEELIKSLENSNGNSHDAGDQNIHEQKSDDSNNDDKFATEINNVIEKIVTQFDDLITEEIPSSNKVETKKTDESHQNIWTFEIEKSDKRDEEQIEKIEEKVEQDLTNYEGSQNSTPSTNDGKHFKSLVEKSTRKSLEEKETNQNGKLNMDIDHAEPQYPVLEKKTTHRKMNGLLLQNSAQFKHNINQDVQRDITREQKKSIQRPFQGRKKDKPKQICHYIRGYVKYAVEDEL